MLDDFREWLSDNLRYILLGLAAILLLVIAFFAVRLISNLGSPKEKESETTQVTTEADTEKESEKQVSEKLTPNDPDLLNLMTKYYTALASGDDATLAAICADENIPKKEKDAAVESYSDFKTYSRKGMTDGSYIVYTYLEEKIVGIETLAPNLTQQYVVTDVEGNLMIEDKESSQELSDFIKEAQMGSDVQALIKDVNNLLAERQEQDEDLKNLVVSRANNSQPGSEDGTGDAEGTANTASGGKMMVTEAINVRGEASATSTQYGTLYQGAEVEVLENLDSGWSHIRYNTADGVTIEGYVMTQYLTATTG